ncbi:THUMP domain-containing class I SAM-dependent RNA methyltransferase [Neolewinella antarctica]|uniref:N6-adenine-specific DNA methylase n=1 Tax=Neolewinella antarctica TaxID=442734 RepID=A0ABX0XCD2_9BACT|nr:class I SAM-dependent RNA methyltransferase [Neolewinella antarctica]NJC26933.1 putative N6-adenine-specific DNA methylase [Neolewinella antarctica]
MVALTKRGMGAEFTVKRKGFSVLSGRQEISRAVPPTRRTFAGHQHLCPIPIFATTTLAGLEEYLVAEIEQLGGTRVEAGRRVVYCEGDKTFRYKANLHLRTGIRVLEEVGYFQANDERELYAGLKKIDWSPWMEPTGNLWITAVTQSDRFRNGVYLTQLFKDAVVDQFRERTGERPNVNKDDADLYLHLHVDRENYVSASLNSSGDGLHRRGYRRRTGGAPLNEVLAAGLLTIAGFDGERPFVDPMCGSGTIVAEAAMIAAHQAPGLNREFAFQRWPDFDADLWSSLRQAALDAIRTPPYPIIGSDVDELTVNLAEVTLSRTGLRPDVELCAYPFALLPPIAIGAAPISEENGGVMIMNPPYEERLKTGDIETFYSEIGDTLKQNWKGYTAWIISGNMDAIKSVGLRTTVKIPLMNGPIEVRYCRYDLYKGSKG